MTGMLLVIGVWGDRRGCTEQGTSGGPMGDVGTAEDKQDIFFRHEGGFVVPDAMTS